VAIINQTGRAIKYIRSREATTRLGKEGKRFITESKFIANPLGPRSVGFDGEGGAASVAEKSSDN
jgi:hypothetical protein